MPDDRSRPIPNQKDMLDEAMSIPIINAGVSRLQRMLGPSCLTSLVIFLLFLVMFRRWVKLPWPALVITLIIIWILVLGAMVRFRNRYPDGDSDQVVERE